MTHAINRRTLLTAAAATAGAALASAVVWTPARAAPGNASTPLNPQGGGTAPAGPLDTVVFGDPASEAAHGLSSTLSDAVTGALGQSARVLNPPAQSGYWGGTVKVTVKVSPEKTTYVTVKLWGGDAADMANQSHDWRLQLFVDGKSVGWYDEAPVDNLDFLDVTPRSPQRFFMHTLPLPEAYTKGKDTLEIEVRSMGRIWDYGGPSTFFYNQTEPSRPIYRIYTHDAGYFVPAPDDVLGTAPAVTTRANTDAQALAAVRTRVMNDQLQLLYGGGTQQMDAWGFNALAEGYLWSQSPAYKNPDALTAVCEAIDGRYNAWKASDAVLTASNQQWQGFGRVGLVLAYLWDDIQSELDKNVTTGQTRLVNPGFELGTSTAVGWKQNIWSGTGTAIRDSTTFHTGTASAKITVPSTGGVVGLIPNGRVALGQGTCSFGFWVKTQGIAANSAYLDILFRDASGNYVAVNGQNDNKYYAPAGTADWQQVTGTIAVPAGATQADVQIRLAGPGTVWFDDLSFSAPPPATSGTPVGRRTAYTDMLRSSRDYWKQNSRHYSNQALITAIGIYQANRGLSLISPADAWPEQQARMWIHESLGIKPWLGSERPDGTRTQPLGTDYYVVTPKGLTRELGYVGGYGEVADWLVMMWESITRGKGGADAPEVRDQMIKIIKTRAYFRHFDIDPNGDRLSRLETVIGWRNEVYPGIAAYVQPTRVDSNPVMAPAVFGDPELAGWAQEMVADGQFGPQLDLLLSNTSTRVGLNAVRMIARDLPAFQALPSSAARMPAAWDAPDFVFTDEVDGAVAVKNGQEIFFASLYWRARQGVNNWGRVHLLTPASQRSATVREQTAGKLSSKTFTIQDWVTWDYAVNDATGGPSPIQAGGWTPPGPTVHQAYAGEVLQLAEIPAGIDPTFGSPTLGTEEALTGRAPFYRLQYGRYIVGMNTTPDQTFTLSNDSHGFARVLTGPAHGDADGPTTVNLQEPIKVPPMSTIILYTL